MAPIGSGDFWSEVSRWVSQGQIVVDRPKGSCHPRHPTFRYPFDYGYVAGTQSGDGAGIDVWIGSSSTQEITGIIATIDREKRDAEVKLLIGCLPDEAQAILKIHNRGQQSAILILHDQAPSPAPAERSPHPESTTNDDTD